MDDSPHCRRCYEDFPVAKEPSGWRMGFLRSLKKAPAKIRRQYQTEWDEEDYLCGNCYFDLTD